MKIFWHLLVRPLFWQLFPRFGLIFPILLVTLVVSDDNEKQTSLLRYRINQDRKKFHGGQCYKTFYGRKLRFFVISKSICSWQNFNFIWGKRSSLFRKVVTYDCKMFYNIGQIVFSMTKIFNQIKSGLRQPLTNKVVDLWQML